MQNFLETECENQQVRIELIDPSTGRPLNSWTFYNRDAISIGRSPDSDVAIVNPYVSRQHACFICRNGAWYLRSLGRNGVLVSNQQVTEQAAGIELVFRLGAQGPTVKFSLTADAAGEAIDSTYHSSDSSFAGDEEVWFELDETQIKREVTEVVESDYFQKLQELAQRMRTQHKPD